MALGVVLTRDGLSVARLFLPGVDVRHPVL